MPFVESTISISGPGRAVYEILTQMERFPDFMPDVKSVRVLQQTERGTVTSWETEIDGMPVSWEEEDIFDPEKMTIEYRLTQGDLERFQGAWQVLESEDGESTVSLTVDFDLGVPMLADVLGPVMIEKVRQNSEMMLAAVKRRIEGA